MAASSAAGHGTKDGAKKYKVVQEWMISYIDETKRKMDQQRVG